MQLEGLKLRITSLLQLCAICGLKFNEQELIGHYEQYYAAQMRADAISHHVSDIHFVLKYLLFKFEIELTKEERDAASRYHTIVVNRNKQRYDRLVNDKELSSRLERELKAGKQCHLHLIRTLRFKSDSNTCRPWSEVVVMLEEAMGRHSKDIQMSQTDRARLLQIFVKMKSMKKAPKRVTRRRTRERRSLFGSLRR